MNIPTQLPHPDQNLGCVTYSQNGEDLVIVNLFATLGVHVGTYLDLGCHHPTNISNTRLLYDRGWRGVCVDANVNVGGDFRRLRPEDTFVCVGVGARDEERTFFMFDDYSGRNTFNGDDADETLNTHPNLKMARCRKLRTTTIENIIQLWCNGAMPQFISCDLEGLDYAAFLACNFEGIGSPLVICVEARGGTAAADMSELMDGKGMRRLLRMGDNIIFVRKGLCL